MKAPTQLTPEDKARIEQWANSKRFYSYEDRRNLMEGAEYATLYERSQQAEQLNAMREEAINECIQALREKGFDESLAESSRILFGTLNELKNK